MKKSTQSNKVDRAKLELTLALLKASVLLGKEELLKIFKFVYHFDNELFDQVKRRP